MDWEAFEKHKAFAGEKKPSMLRRRVGHDYEQRCVYLVTMTVEGRRPLLGRLVGNAGAESGSSDAPHVELSPLGKQVREMWEAISEYYPEVRVLATMVMPDHLHGILFVERAMDQPLGMVIKGFKAGCNKAYRQAMAAGLCAPMLQHCCSKENGKENDRTHGFLFSRNYNDHILEGEGELERWFRYLADNPRRLAVKRQHPEYFTIVRDVRIGEWACQTVGNQYLLSYPEKAAVIVHSAYSDEEFKKLKAQWLALAARGGVLISAAVATREKEVMREAMNSGYRLIALRENGFSPLYKPAGESFAACSQGTLLQVSPWEYHMNRRTISREQCLQLNRMAEWIAEH
jgi:REP element-mobilizing transposase RayT